MALSFFLLFLSSISPFSSYSDCTGIMIIKYRHPNNYIL